jgi:hypothetical protein
MAIPIIVPSLPTANILIAVTPNNPGRSGGGVLNVARFTTGPSLPTFSPGRKVRS